MLVATLSNTRQVHRRNLRFRYSDWLMHDHTAPPIRAASYFRPSVHRVCRMFQRKGLVAPQLACTPDTPSSLDLTISDSIPYLILLALTLPSQRSRLNDATRNAHKQRHSARKLNVSRPPQLRGLENLDVVSDTVNAKAMATRPEIHRKPSHVPGSFDAGDDIGSGTGDPFDSQNHGSISNSSINHSPPGDTQEVDGCGIELPARIFAFGRTQRKDRRCR